MVTSPAQPSTAPLVTNISFNNKVLKQNVSISGIMKIVVYANVGEDWKERVHTPYGIAQFRSYINRNFITSDLPYTHPNWKAVEGDIIIWAFRDVKDVWYLLGDGYVRSKCKNEEGNYWMFWMEGARLYPRSIALDELSFANKKDALNVGFALEWKQYKEIIEKAGIPLA
jgi:hypothetical protein